jgi:hypothetical protein
MRNSRVIILDYIHTEKNLVGLFTKGLPHNVIDAASKEMSLRPHKLFHSATTNIVSYVWFLLSNHVLHIEYVDLLRHDFAR